MYMYHLFLLYPPPHTRNICKQHHFPVSHRTLPTKAERSDFIDYLLYKYLVIDVYDGDSLILMGSANIPLKVCMSF